MNRQFWKLRLSTAAWGFGVAYLFTGTIDLTSKIVLTQIAGNTANIWWFTREKKQ